MPYMFSQQQRNSSVLRHAGHQSRTRRHLQQYTWKYVNATLGFLEIIDFAHAIKQFYHISNVLFDYIKAVKNAIQTNV